MAKTKKVVVSEEQKVAAALNDPKMSKHEIVLQGKTYKVIDLPYDSYLKFITYLKPLFETIFSYAQTAEADRTSLPKIDFTYFMDVCKTTLPDMAQLVLQQTEPDITVNEVKQLCRTPFKMAEVVLIQIDKNEIIQDFTAFFPQLARLGTSLSQ